MLDRSLRPFSHYLCIPMQAVASSTQNVPDIESALTNGVAHTLVVIDAAVQEGDV